MSFEDLTHYEGHWPTLMGAAFLGERAVFRGKDLHLELGDQSWFELFLFSITNRFFDEKSVKILNYIWVNTSYPDPRIWPNRIASLGGSAKTTPILSCGAAILVSEASKYGRRPDKRAIDFLYRTQVALDKGELLDDIVSAEMNAYRVIFGYGRPISGGTDERIPHMLTKLRHYALDQSPYVQLAFKIADIVKAKWRFCMNIAILDAAVAADIGLSVDEYHIFMSLAFFAGYVPCFIEAANRPGGCFFPIKCEDIVSKDRQLKHW